MHHLAACLLTATLLMGSAISAWAAPAFRADFEGEGTGSPPGWRFAATRGECSGEWVEGEPAGGRSLRLRIPKDETARATWTCVEKIPLKPSTAYRLSLRVLYATRGEKARAYVIAYENGVETPECWHVMPFLNGACDWRTYALEFRTRPDCEWLRLQCKLWDGAGTAWFDDVAIEELPPGREPDERIQRRSPKDDGSPLQLWWYPAQRRPDETLTLLPGLLNPLCFFPWGDPAAVKDPVLVLETPPEMALRGEVVVGRLPFPPEATLRPETVTRDGARRSLWRVPIPPDPLAKLIRKSGPNWTSYYHLYVQPREGCPREFAWRWRLECAGKPGPEHEIRARLVERKPGTAGVVPEFPVYAQHSSALRLPTAEGRRQVLDWLKYAGIQGGLSLGHYQPEYASVDAELRRAGYDTWAWRFDGYGGRGAEERPLIDEKGEVIKGSVCPQAQVEKLPAWWDGLCGYYREHLARGEKTLIIDFEPPTARVCFCPRCREAFARHARLDPAKVAAMAPAEIRKLPDAAWGRFRARQNGDIVRHHIEAIHRSDPEVRVGLCCSAYTPAHADDGMDIRLFEPEVGFHAPMIYYVGTTYEQLVRSTCEGTRAPVIPFVLASDLVVGIFPMPDDLHANLLATALSGGRGAILWVGIESLDGEYMNAVRDALERIGRLQPYLAGASRCDVAVRHQPARTRTLVVEGEEISVPAVPAPTSVRSWGWHSVKGTLAGFINYDAENAYAFVVPGAGGAKSVFGPAPARQGQDALLRLQPGEAAAIAW